MSVESNTAPPGVTTAIELRRQGVVFGYDRRGRRTIQAPSDAELAKSIREAIERRVPGVRIPPESTSGWWNGQCATCDDELEKYRSGMCELCQCAREKWLVATGVLPPREIA